MLLWIKQRIEKCPRELSAEERNLLCVAYKSLIGPCRAAWRILLSCKEKEERKPQPAAVALKIADLATSRVLKEITDICQDVFHLVEQLQPRTKDLESIIVFQKM